MTHSTDIDMDTSQATPVTQETCSTKTPSKKIPSEYITTSNDDFPTSIEALLALEKDYPSLQVSIRLTKKGDYIFTTTDSDTARILQDVKVLSSDKTVTLGPYTPPPKTTKMVVEGYPLGFPLDHIKEHPLIESATQLVARPSKEETRQVLVTILGEPITEIQLGIFGTFHLREYYPEPPRCARCQRFDHLAAKCRSHPRCGVCAEYHLTNICIKKLKEGQTTIAKCPNYGDHHAWNPICPECFHVFPFHPAKP